MQGVLRADYQFYKAGEGSEENQWLFGIVF